MPNRNPLKFELHKIRVNAGGYDRTGSYWGAGSDTVYHALAWNSDTKTDIEYWFRAADRLDAKNYVISEHPTATFYS